MKFKALYSINQMFDFRGTKYNCIDGFFETIDADLIEFLKQNQSFEVVEDLTKKSK